MMNFLIVDQVVDLVAQCQGEARHLSRKDCFQVVASAVVRLAERELVVLEFVEQQKKELKPQVFAEHLVSELVVQQECRWKFQKLQEQVLFSSQPLFSPELSSLLLPA